MNAAWILLALAAPVAVIGMGASVHGRLGLHRQDNGTYRGTSWAWLGYLGGILLVAFAIVMMIVGLAKAMTA